MNPEREDAVEREWTLSSPDRWWPKIIAVGPQIEKVGFGEFEVVVVPKSTLVAAQRRAEENDAAARTLNERVEEEEQRAKKAESERDDYKTKYERLNNGQEK